MSAIPFVHRRAFALVAAIATVTALFVVTFAAGATTQKAASSSAAARATQSAATVDAIKAINYYPSQHGWTDMWSDWQPDVIAGDFAHVKSLGANTVRVHLFPSQFGFPTPSGTMTARFQSVMNMASTAGLNVQLTLFDWWGVWNAVSQSATWAQTVLAPYANNPRLTMVELANEVDPTSTSFLAWARGVLPAVQAVVPQATTTISVNGDLTTLPPRVSALVSALRSYGLDAADVHVYVNARDIYPLLDRAKTAAAGLPVFVGEAGLTLPTTNGVSSVAGEYAQAAYVNQVFVACSHLGLSLPAVWTLNDFASSAMPAGHSMNADGYSYGIYRLNGTQRPVAGVVKAWFNGQGTSFDTFNGSFSAALSDGTPQYWLKYFAQYGDVNVDPTVGHAALGSVRLAATGTPAGGVPSVVIRPKQPVVAGQRWTLSAWAKGAGATGYTRIGLSWYDVNSNFLGNTDSTGVASGTSGWTQLQVSTVVPSGAAGVQVALRSAGNRGTVWFDDVIVSTA